MLFTKVLRFKGLGIKLIPSCNAFSATRSNFVRGARVLENLKTADSVPELVYLNGQYMLTAKDGDLVLINENANGFGTLVWKNYNSVAEGSSLENVISNSVILDAVIDKENGKEKYIFALNNPDVTPENKQVFESTNNGTLMNLRKSLFNMSDEDSARVLQAKALMYFCKTVLYCCFCGTSLKLKSAGTQKYCDTCKKVHYPNISPVGITLIENKSHSKVLLVRQARHPPGMYSCVAGFIEPGESLEHNVHREVAEEVGLEVEHIEYISSQHWAFGPSLLMLGCIATATTDDFEPDKVEIEDAKWVEAEELYKAVNSTSDILLVPPKVSQAHTLMQVWLKKHHKFNPVQNKL